MNGWDVGGVRVLGSGSAGAAVYGVAERAMTPAQSGSVRVAFLSTDSLVAQHAFSVAIGAAAAAVTWLLIGLLVYLVRKALKKQRGETSPAGHG